MRSMRAAMSSKRLFMSSMRALTAAICPAICADSSPPSTTTVPMIHFVSLLTGNPA